MHAPRPSPGIVVELGATVLVIGAAVVDEGGADVVGVGDGTGAGSASPTSFTSAQAAKTSLQHFRLPMVASQLSAEFLPELQKPPQYQLLHQVFCGPTTLW
jgi:hypothetical protein